jgi:hypothetical protein
MTATILRRGDRCDQNFKLRHYRNRNYLDTYIGIGLSYACYFFLRKPTACPKGKAPFRKPPTEANDMTESKANEATGAADYATGYGKPPLHTRFPKGQSGNPAGRPPNAARLRVKALTLEEAYRAVVVREDGVGRTEPVPALQADRARHQRQRGGPTRRPRCGAGDRRGRGRTAHRRSGRSHHRGQASARGVIGRYGRGHIKAGFSKIP